MPVKSTFRTLLTVTTFFLITFLHMGTEAVSIRNIKAPEPMVNGTGPSAILDCDYSYDEKDVDDLVVKWFMNTAKEPVYQWIPKQGFPQSAGRLRDRLDLTFRVSDDNLTMYRALRIVNPTVELGGNYRCQVSSNQNEDEKSKAFVVYAPATSVDINITKTGGNTVNVTCKSQGMFPEPEASIFIHSAQNVLLKETPTVVSQLSEQGGYAVVAHRLFEDSKLASKVTFECRFSIPNVQYAASDKDVYISGNGTTNDTSDYTTSEAEEAPLDKLSTPAPSIIWFSTELPSLIGRASGSTAPQLEKMAIMFYIFNVALLVIILQQDH